MPHSHVIGRYFNSFNAIYNHNMMHHSGPALDKYWVAHSGYFMLATTVTLGIVIIDANILFYHVISDIIRYKTISMIYYNDRTVYL